MQLRVLLLIVLCAPLVWAGPTRTIESRTGKQQPGVRERVDDEGLTFSQSGRETMVGWDELKPRSAYEARKELTSYDDAAERVALADFARKLKLFPEAMEQYEIALALGGLDEAAFEKLAQQIEQEEIAYLTARIDALLKSKAEPEACLEAIKRLKSRYPTHPRNEEYQPHIERLVKILADRKQQEIDAEQQQKESKELAALRKKILKLQEKKVKALRTASKLQDEAKVYIERRSISGLKKKLLEPKGAEKHYKKARQLLRDMVRADRQFQIVDKKQVQREFDAIAKELIECFLPPARLYMRERNYKRAVKMVQKILFYDPIHEEALEMARIIRKNRITFKASDITGIRGPIVTPK
ncbi:MAG: hypothetical protein AAGD14_16145 [Planctomycetota bacterium]